MFTGIALKLFLSGLWKKITAVAGFCVEHWKIVLPVAIAAIMLWQWYSAEKALQQVTHDYKAYQDANATAAKVRIAENAAAERRMKESISDIRIESAKQLAKLEENYHALQRQKGNADRDAVNLREQLRHQLEVANATARLPGLPDRSIGLAKTRGDGYATDSGQVAQDYTDTLEAACAITTLDYNDLYKRCETANKVYGQAR